jgi:hypothetical protein
MALTDIVSVSKVMDVDDTVAFFEVDTNRRGQNEPDLIVINYEGNPELAKVHDWLASEGQPIPDYSSFLIEE